MKILPDQGKGRPQSALGISQLFFFLSGAGNKDDRNDDYG
jgi:hypothetical protein